MSVIRTDCFGERYAVRGDWSNASSPIEERTDGAWIATGRQVADFCHSPQAALRAAIEHSCEDISSEDSAAIDAAMLNAEFD